MENFQEIIKEVLVKEKLTQLKACSIVGLKPQQFGAYVRGKNVPNFNLAKEMLEKLNWKITVHPNF